MSWFSKTFIKPMVKRFADSFERKLTERLVGSVMDMVMEGKLDKAELQKDVQRAFRDARDETFIELRLF